MSHSTLLAIKIGASLWVLTLIFVTAGMFAKIFGNDLLADRFLNVAICFLASTVLFGGTVGLIKLWRTDAPL